MRDIASRPDREYWRWTDVLVSTDSVTSYVHLTMMHGVITINGPSEVNRILPKNWCFINNTVA